MTNFTPAELAAHLQGRLLLVPRDRLRRPTSSSSMRRPTASTSPGRPSYDVGGLFAAGGTGGEGFSLTVEENARVVRAAVEASRDEVPVLGSAGG